MKDNRYYYDEQIKDYYYGQYYREFLNIKKDIEDTSLRGLLSLQTKNSLMEISKRIEAKGYSKLSKEELISFLSNYIKENITQIIKGITYSELIFIEDLLKNKVNNHNFNIEDLSKIGGLSSLGVLHKVNIKGEYKLIVADEFKLSLEGLLQNKEYMIKLKEHSKGIWYIDGLMAQYGMLLGEDLYRIINEDTNNLFDKENSDFYYNYLFRSYEAFVEANSLIHPFIFSPEDIYSELKRRQTIKYNFNNVEYLINLGKDYKFGFGIEVEDLKLILLDKGVDKKIIDNLLMKLVFYIKNDIGTMSIVQLLEEKGIKFENEKENDKLINALAELYNNTPMWVLKGLTPKEVNEIRRTTIVKGKQLGRNDPCSCGSGKKYKKCCGRS